MPNQKEKECYLCNKQIVQWFWWPLPLYPKRDVVCRDCGNRLLTAESMEEYAQQYKWDVENVSNQ